MMSKIIKLREELAQLDLLIQTHSQLLEHMMLERYGGQAGSASRYPTSINEMWGADESLRMLYAASARLGELCWQQEIKKEILRMVEEATSPSPRAAAR